MRSPLPSVLITSTIILTSFELSSQSDPGASSSKPKQAQAGSSSQAPSFSQYGKRSLNQVVDTIQLGEGEQLIVHTREQLVLLKINATSQTVIPFKTNDEYFFGPYSPFVEYRIVGGHYEAIAVQPNVWITDLNSYHCLYARVNNHGWIYNKAVVIYREEQEIGRRRQEGYDQRVDQYRKSMRRYGRSPKSRRGF